MHFIKISTFNLGIDLIDVLSTSARETMKAIRRNFMDALPSSNQQYALDGKLVTIEGECWALEYLLGDQRRLQIEAETRLALSRKQREIPFMPLSEIMAIRRSYNNFTVHGGGTGL